MAINLKDKFTDQVTFEKYFGITGARIVVDDAGSPIINPTRKTLSEQFEGYDIEGDEREYTGVAKITSGWTDFKENGGKERKSKETFEELSITDKEDFVEEQEIPYTNITFLIETLGSIKIKKLITFKLFKTKAITKKGDKIKVFNKYGMTAYKTTDGKVPEFFDNSEDALVRNMPLSRSAMDFEALINFLYGYSSLSKKEALLEDIDLAGIFEGDISSIEEIVIAIHEGIINDKNMPLYGVMLLFMVENNDNTRNKDIQTYYPAFERMITDNKGTTNKECPIILNSIAKSRRPQSNNRVYSPESKGQFVGHDGLAKLGLKEFKTVYMDAIKAEAINVARKTANTPNTPGGDVFGSKSEDDYEF